MDKDEILGIMEESEGSRVEVENVRGETFTGIVDLYETRYDNEDEDEPYAGEASICIDCDDGTVCMLYESDIDSIEITD